MRGGAIATCFGLAFVATCFGDRTIEISKMDDLPADMQALVDARGDNENFEPLPKPVSKESVEELLAKGDARWELFDEAMGAYRLAAEKRNGATGIMKEQHENAARAAEVSGESLLLLMLLLLLLLLLLPLILRFVAAAVTTAAVAAAASHIPLTSQLVHLFGSHRGIPLFDRHAVWKACSKARILYQAAFVRDESHAVLVQEQLAARLMALYEGSLLHPAGDHIEGKKKAQTQASLLNMIARIGKLAVESKDDASRALGKRWLSQLMHLHFESRSSKWRSYKAQLIDAGLLPEGYTNPAAEQEAKDEL